MEAGGYATAWSMRFQNLWAVRQVLRVIAEELLAVRIEPAGSEGEGVDLLVTLQDRTSEYQQCKRSHGQSGKWTLRALQNEGVLSALRDRLASDRTGFFRLVSVDPAPDLRDLGDSARASLDSESFVREQVGQSLARRKAFEHFCSAVQLDPDRSDQAAHAHDLLRRTFTTISGDDIDVRRDLRSHARPWVDGDPDAILTALESWTQETLRTSITAATVASFLRGHGFHPRVLARDPRILPAVLGLQERFEQSLQPQLVGGRLLPREEANRLFELLTLDDGPDFVAVHGPAGVGKSGVLLALASELRQGEVLFLPLRLDRQRPKGTTKQFGESLELPESPALCLEALAGGRTGVLILDQLDALRWTGSQAAEALEICRDLVKEAMRFANLKVVACCRSFDLENDPLISGWIEQQKARKLPVERLSEKVVRHVVTEIGVDPERLTPRQLDLLRTIQHLRIWEQTVQVTRDVVDFASDRQLLEAFWKTRLREAEAMGVSSANMQEAVDAVVFYMDNSATLVAPRRLLHGRGLVEEALFSLQVLSAADGNVMFSHQMYLDYLLAQLLLRRIDEGSTTVAEWLTAGHQGLSRREQLRLVLGILRDEPGDRYAKTLWALLDSTDVRFHLRQLVLQFLGQQGDPRPTEVELVVLLLRREQWQEHVIADVIHAHPVWFDQMENAGLLSSWLESDGRVRDQALHLVHSVIEERGTLCNRLLAPLAERGPELAQRVANALPMAPARDSAELFELRLRLAELGINRFYTDWEGLGGPSLERLVRLVTVVVGRLTPDDSAPEPLRDLSHCVDKIEVAEVSLEELTGAWRASVLVANTSFRSDLEDEIFPLEGPGRDWRVSMRQLLRRLTAEVVSRDPLLAVNLADESGCRLGEMVLLEVLPSIDDPQAAERALQWLTACPYRLRLRWSHSDLPWELSGRAIEQLTRVCPPDTLSAFEGWLLDFKEPRLREEMEWRHKLMLAPEDEQPRFADWLLSRPSHAGETAYHLLPCLPQDRLSSDGSRRLAELQRKFSSEDEIFFAGWGKIRSGTVGSPLSIDKLTKLSDRTWLDVISRNQTARVEARGLQRYRDGKFERSSPETFAADLQAATARQPARFARLALRFPENTNPVYFLRLLWGLDSDHRDAPEREDVTLEDLETLLALRGVRDEPELAMAIARVIGRYAEFEWSAATLQLLASIASDHGDPSAGQLHPHVGRYEDRGPNNLVTDALNCTRGAAGFAIAKLLFADPRRLDQFSSALDHLAADPQPAVRAATFECCLAVLRGEPARSIEWALRAAEGHEVLLACSTFDRFLLFASRRYPAELEPTLHRMLKSARDDVAQTAARHVVALHLLTGRLGSSVRNCLEQPGARRVGAAEVAAAFAASPDHHRQACSMLLQFLDDEDDEVLRACAESLGNQGLEVFRESTEFLKAFASSKAFQRSPFVLLHRLKDHEGSLMPFADCVLAACRSLVSARNEQRIFAEAEYYLPPVLLRLYEQAPDRSQIKERCLDAWDILLEGRVVSAVRMTDKLEKDS